MLALTMFRKRRPVRFALMCLTLGLGSLGVSQATAETRAVVIGINDYINLSHPQGAVADANDISGALKQAGVTDLVTLIDSDATRKNVLGAIDRLIARAKMDDLAVITFAGLGARERWGMVHPPGTKDASYRIFLLRNVAMPSVDGGGDPKLPGSTAERILEAEIAVRLKRLDDMGVRTIFVDDADAGSRMSFRLADGTDPLEPVIGLLPASIDIDTDTRSLSFLAAVDNSHRVPEVDIPKGSGHKRGALSYAFARVIEGAALRDGQTGLSQGELINFVQTSIKNNCSIAERTRYRTCVPATISTAS